MHTLELPVTEIAKYRSLNRLYSSTAGHKTSGGSQQFPRVSGNLHAHLGTSRRRKGEKLSLHRFCSPTGETNAEYQGPRRVRWLSNFTHASGDALLGDTKCFRFLPLLVGLLHEGSVSDPTPCAVGVNWQW